MFAIPWIAFIALILVLLALDLGVLNRNAHVIGTKEALRWTIFWVALALLFSVAIFFMYEYHWMGIGIHEGATESGWQATEEYITGYLIEKSLSLDNIAVIAMIFSYFSIPLKFQHRILFWGILGALIMRGAMILAGTALVQRFDWVLYVFAVFLLYTAYKTAFAHETNASLADNRILKLARRIFPVTSDVSSLHFFVRVDGKRAATPLFLALILVESSDVIFAVDSIPAIFLVTTDPFIVFTSNIFAILGLRSLYFVLASLLERFSYLRYSVTFILAYVGVKMLIGHHIVIPGWVSLVVITLSLSVGIGVSVYRLRKHPIDAPAPPRD
ncbi:MAG: TerC family protein [Myxococcota bacterium]|nr:TerC family protein [Myxococcota bacterium]